MDALQKIIIAFELHDAAGIREGFRRGVDPNMVHRGKPLIYELINMYTRGPEFKSCVKAFVDFGLVFEDQELLAVLTDNAGYLDELLDKDKNALTRKYTFDCAFTPLVEASLLHICAEYNHLACAQILVKHGADVNAKAACDQNGFGGHTPVFHTVNQDANKSLAVLKFLLAHNADLLLTVKGLIWGQGYEWETFVPAVNPISYAMMGLLRQFQRSENDIYEVVALLLRAAYGIEYVPQNVPNRYLSH